MINVSLCAMFTGNMVLCSLEGRGPVRTRRRGDARAVRPDLGEVSRQAALKIFLSLFKPGEIVALALASNEGAD